MLVGIYNDIFFINSRIQEIDKNYQIYFNTIKESFEIHNHGQIRDSYCLTVPYSRLDSRTIDFVRKTRVENRKKLFEEIEKNNEMVERRREKEIFNEAKDRLYEEIKYSRN